MESITKFIETKLKLKVNREKSRVSRPQESTLLGFSFYRGKGGWEIRLSSKTMQRIRARLKACTQRSDATPIRERIRKIEEIKRGWVNYFAIAKMKGKMGELDGSVRMRLRMCLWKQWKQVKTKFKQLRGLGVSIVSVWPDGRCPNSKAVKIHPRIAPNQSCSPKYKAGAFDSRCH